MSVHVPVMTAEVLAFLAPERGGIFVDCTVGLGGHARALAQGGATRLVGLDRDPEALVQARETLSEWLDRVELIHADFRQLPRILDERGLVAIDGALADLGVSSLQFNGAGRGFSFQRDEPLDMRMDASTGPTAADLIAAATEEDLANVIYQFGEERRSRAVARAIAHVRRQTPIRTTGQLAALVRRVVGRGSHRIDPATRTFQALRIWVNRELDGLTAFVHDTCARLRAGARFVILTFHSLEDRPVKHALRDLARAEGSSFRLLTKKPVVPGSEEIRLNPRARSAKLRAIERLM